MIWKEEVVQIVCLVIYLFRLLMTIMRPMIIITTRDTGAMIMMTIMYMEVKTKKNSQNLRQGELSQLFTLI